MKGFGIYVKNSLIDPKHISAFGPTPLWLYLWCLDKMTSINESGVGLILGGKPIKFNKDIQPIMEISEKTYNRWLSILRGHGYIITKRTPHGLVIHVNKAEKLWKKRTVTNDVSRKSEPSDVTAQNRQISPIRTVRSVGSNKTRQLDKTVDKTRVGKTKFSPPSLDDVRKYCLERKSGVDAEQFLNFYESKGWYVGKNKMKDWRAAVRTWERRNTSKGEVILV